MRLAVLAVGLALAACGGGGSEPSPEEEAFAIAKSQAEDACQADGGLATIETFPVYQQGALLWMNWKCECNNGRKHSQARAPGMPK